MFGEFCPHPKFAKHEKPNRTFALPLSERPSERGVKPNDSEAKRCKHHKRSPPQRAVQSSLGRLRTSSLNLKERKENIVKPKQKASRTCARVY